MKTDRAFAEFKLGLNAQLLNVTLLWRRFRRREINFTPEGAKFYEDELLALRLGLGDVEHEYDERFRAAIDLMDRMANVLRRNLPDRARPADLIELGELLQSLTAMNDARGLTPAAATIPESAKTGPVYQPEDNRPRGFLKDMARPAVGHTLRPLGRNVIDIRTAVPRRADAPDGGAA